MLLHERICSTRAPDPARGAGLIGGADRRRGPDRGRWTVSEPH
jgi:hypothetical protein